MLVFINFTKGSRKIVANQAQPNKLSSRAQPKDQLFERAFGALQCGTFTAQPTTHNP